VNERLGRRGQDAFIGVGPGRRLPRERKWNIQKGGTGTVGGDVIDNRSPGKTGWKGACKEQGDGKG